MTDFWSKAVQKKKSKVVNESLPTISQETNERVTINYKSNSQPLTETPVSTTNTAAAQEEVKRKINTENDILVGLFRKRDF